MGHREELYRASDYALGKEITNRIPGIGFGSAVPGLSPDPSRLGEEGKGTGAWVPRHSERRGGAQPSAEEGGEKWAGTRGRGEVRGWAGWRPGPRTGREEEGAGRGGEGSWASAWIPRAFSFFSFFSNLFFQSLFQREF